jgi:O-antigen/teichoic acid export membrane protein
VFKKYSLLPLSTIVGQGINILITFYLLKNYYSPADFGLYSNFIALSVLLSCLFSLRLEIILALIKKDYINQYFIYIVKIIISIFIILFFVKLLLFRTAPIWIYYSFFSALALSLQNLIKQYLFITGNLKYIILDNLVRPILQIVLPLFFINTKYKIEVLFLAYILGIIFGLFIMIKTFYNNRKSTTYISVDFSIFFSEIKLILFYNFPSQLINIFGVTLIPVYISFLFNNNISGQFSFVISTLSIPVALFGGTLSQILYPILSRKTVVEKRNIVSTLFIILFIFTSFFFLPFIFFGKEIFILFFGSKWTLSGEFSKFMAFFFLISMLSTPFSTIPIIFKKNKSVFYVSIVETISRIVAIYIGYLLKSYFISILLYSIVSTGIYAYYFYWVLNLINLTYYSLFNYYKRFFIINFITIFLLIILNFILPFSNIIFFVSLLVILSQFIYNLKRLFNENFNSTILVL